MLLMEHSKIATTILQQTGKIYWIANGANIPVEQAAEKIDK